MGPREISHQSIAEIYKIVNFSYEWEKSVVSHQKQLVTATNGR